MTIPSMTKTTKAGRYHLRKCVRIFTLLGLIILNGEAAAIVCPDGSSAIDWTSPQGTRWEMCWHHETRSGLVLRNVFYTDGNGGRRLVLRDGSIAQLFLAYDDGSRRIDYVTSGGGLGGNRLRKLTSSDCFGTSASIYTHASRPALCAREVQRPYLFRWYNEQAQGTLLELFSISDISEHTFVVRWRFYEDGTIEPAVGHSGRIVRYSNNLNFSEPTGSGNAVSWSTNIFWRLDLDIDGPSHDSIREINIQRHGENLERQRRLTSELSNEMARNISPGTMRWWQIYDTRVTNSDGHNISYELAPYQGGIRHRSNADSWSANDLYITRWRACERYVMNNAQSGCGTDIHSFMNGQTIQSANLVLWYRVSRHHFPRDEDIPYRSLKWDNFLLIPRDWNSLSPLTNVVSPYSLDTGGHA